MSNDEFQKPWLLNYFVRSDGFCRTPRGVVLTRTRFEELFWGVADMFSVRDCIRDVERVVENEDVVVRLPRYNRNLGDKDHPIVFLGVLPETIETLASYFSPGDYRLPCPREKMQELSLRQLVAL